MSTGLGHCLGNMDGLLHVCGARLVAWLLLPGAYFLGSVPFGLILCRVIKGVDIREHGSKNIGAANAGRVCGWPFFVATFALDFLKGLLPVVLVSAALARAGSPSELREVQAGVAAILGHSFPIYLRFRGGKGVATGLGVFVALAPLPAAIALCVWLLVFIPFRYASLASIAGTIAAPIAYALHYCDNLQHRPVFIFALAMSILVIVRHRANIRRLLNGTESRFRGER